MSEPEYKTPDWYDEEKLIKAYYVLGEYSGWVIDLGDGTCRFANQPMLGDDGPNWGDRVRLVKTEDGRPVVDLSEIIEKYDQEVDRIKEEEE